MRSRRASERQLALSYRKLVDMFGHIPVTRLDVYAWMLGVVNLDPANQRALRYFRGYNVPHKITIAKLEGRFDECTKAARESTRYRELMVESPAPVTSTNVAGLADWAPSSITTRMQIKQTNAPRRPRKVIQKEKTRMRKEINTRKQLKMSYLSLLPKTTPALTRMIQDLGNPSVETLGMALDVTPSTVRRWIKEDAAPKTALLALYWITSWGMSQLDADARNQAVESVGLVRALQTRVSELEHLLEKTKQIGSFGSANDPSSLVPVTSASLACLETAGQTLRVA